MSSNQQSGGFNEDTLLVYVVKVRRFFIKNKNTIITLSLIALALIVFFVVRAIESQKAEEEASIAFERASLLLRDDNVRERIGDIETQLDDIIKKWPDTLGAARASFHLGHMQYGLENYAGALESYTRAAGYSSSIHIYPASLLGIANCYEQTGEHERAIEYYSRVETLSSGFGYKNTALLGKARCLAVQGDLREARRLFEIVSNESGSPLSEEANQALIWIDGMQETPILPGN